MKQVIKAIQENLTTDLLQSKYRKQITKDTHPYFGHCYIATEAAYHIQGKQEGYKPQVMRIDENTTHWYLKKGDEILDITQEQFPFELDYSLGRGCGFLTKKPSKRTIRLFGSILIHALHEIEKDLNGRH